MNDAIRVGTRRSPLARAQTQLVIDALESAVPGSTVIPVPITTAGDRTRSTTGPLDFTDALDAALEAGAIDLAVHSAKDLPARLRPSVRVVAVPRRDDPRDCLVLSRPGSLRTLPAGAKIGSSSLRRGAQLHRLRPDVEVIEIRGNVDSRIARVRAGELDGVMLAAAGLRRLGRASEIDDLLDTRRFLPAPGQGALAVTAQAGDRRMARLTPALDHLPSRTAVAAERAFSLAIGGDCSIPLAAFGTVRGSSVVLRAEVFPSVDGRAWSGRISGTSRPSSSLGRRLARRALDAGVGPWQGPRSN